MPLKVFVLRLILVAALASVFLLHRTTSKNIPAASTIHFSNRFAVSEEEEGEGEEESEGEHEEEFTKERTLHEFKMLRNPVTGTIPKNIHAVEAEVARNVPDRNFHVNPWLSGSSGLNDITNQNNYISIGPANISGRSRTLAFDQRNANILLSGGTTGGIFKSTDGGATWNFVTPEAGIRSATSIAQNPVSPDTWYCGTGEVYYVSSQQATAATFGNGVYKSTDNGNTWTLLTSTQANPATFDSPFDLVHRIAVHPTTGYVYAAGHRRIMRSKDGGQNWEQVLGSTITGTALGGVTEILIPPNGSKIFAAVTGGNPDRNLVGVWESSTGDANSWRRIAGGVKGQADSVAGWRPYGKWDRIVLALNSAQTQLYVLYKNGDTASGPDPKPEADLFRCNISSSNPSSYTWTNLNAYVPDEANYDETGIDPYTTQFNGFDMSIAVKPDNDNILFIGGTVLDRVDLTQTNQARKFRRIGGYGRGFFEDEFFYPNHHPDIHGIYFQPGNSNTLYTASDGGIHKTATSVLADTVRWQHRDSLLQTLQYQFVNISPDTDYDFIIGGAQDNGTLININAPASLDHLQIGSGDGAAAAISAFTKTGDIWKQHWYFSISSGSVYRQDIALNTTTSDLSTEDFNEITPNGLGGQGQWLTLFLNDPDSTEHLYYNNKNELYRTTHASTVTSSTWTNLTGVGNTVPSNENISAMDISKRIKGNKYLYFGTDNGHVYRLNNPNTASPTTTPANITPATMTTGSYVAGVSVNPRNPDTVMVVVSNYDATSSTVSNIFWTGNATAATPTWQVIDGALEALSSQSCAIVVKTTGVEFYVGTSMGLYSATALNGNSTSWVQEGSGMLKTAIVRSLVNRQKDNTLVVGTHGNGAFIAQIGDAVTIGDVATGVTDPILNDKNFIKIVYPTLTNNNIQYQIGNLFTVKKIVVQLVNMKGQLMYEEQRGYQNGGVDMTRFASGLYILVINSDDGKYKHVQRIMKQ